MISAMIEALLAVQLAVSLGVLVVLALRRPVRQLAGARLAFGLWALPVIAGLAVMAPGPFYSADAGAPAGVVEIAPRNDVEASIPLAPGDAVTKPASPNGEVRPSTVMPAQGLGVPAVMWLALWGAGILVTATVLGVRQYRFHLALRPMQAVPELGPDVFRAGSPHVGAGLVGAAKPKIIVPADFEARFNTAEIKLILEHEREHRRAGHAQFNAIAALVLVLCWMNPLVHLGLRWFRLDQELACDAAILERSQKSARTYGAALLRAQTGVAAPFGCTWRPANGLSTRIKALGSATPAAVQRGLGAAGLTILLAGVGATSWAARPELHNIEQDTPALAGATEQAYDGLTAAETLSRVTLRGVNGQVAIIAERRSDIAVEGLASNILTRRDGHTMVVEVSDLTTDICDRGGPVTQDFTLRVPVGVHVDIEGRMDARVNAPSDVTLNVRGCGTVNLGNVEGDLTLGVGGQVAVNGEHIEGRLWLDALGQASIDLVHVDGPIEIQTAGRVSTDIEAVEAGGRVNLSGRSTLDVEDWTGLISADLSGRSDFDIESITADLAMVTVSGASSADIEDGRLGEIRIDQAANADFYFGGQSARSRVRNRGYAPVVLTKPGQLDSQGRVNTGAGPPGD